VPSLEIRRIQPEALHRRRTLAVVPSIRQEHSAYIEKNYVEGKHRRLFPAQRASGNLSF
jgi:hypothetical protein